MDPGYWEQFEQRKYAKHQTMSSTQEMVRRAKAAEEHAKHQTVSSAQEMVCWAKEAEQRGYPPDLMPIPSGCDTELPIPTVGLHEDATKLGSLHKIFNNEIKIFVTPDKYFSTKFQEIFLKTKIKHTTGKESKQWLEGPVELDPGYYEKTIGALKAERR